MKLLSEIHFRRHHVHDVILLLAIVAAGHSSSTSLGLGGGVFGVGLLMAGWSKLVLNRNSELSTNGPYTICRHPFYLGNAIMDVGMCLMAGFPWLLLLFPFLFYVGYRHTFAYEESNLKEWFPDSHRQFSRTTPLLLPFGRRIFQFQAWRAELKFDRIFSEHVVSRSLRHVAFPALIILASRWWKTPVAEWLAPIDLTLIVIVVAARGLSSIVFWTFEADCQRKSRPVVLSWLHSFPLTALGLLVFLGAVIWEGGSPMAVVEALPWGVAMLSAEMLASRFGRRFPDASRRLLAPLAGCVVGGGLVIFFETVYLLPVVLVLALARVVLQPAGGSGVAARKQFAPTVAAVGLLLSVSAIAVELHLDHQALQRLAHHLNAVVRPADVVIVVDHNDLRSLKKHTRIDDEVTPAELPLLVAQTAGRAGRLIVVHDLDDKNLFTPAATGLDEKRIDVGTGTDSFCILIM